MKKFLSAGTIGLQGALAFIVLAALIYPRIAHAACNLKDGGETTIVEVLNTESLLLEDGRAIRLVGALAPRTEPRWARAMGLEEKIIQALEDHVVGKPVQLRFGERERDRYGRLLTHVFTGTGDDTVWVQEALIKDGLAMSYSFADNRACVRELQEVEDRARQAEAGLWKQGIFRIRDAGDPGGLDALSYSFQIVEGRVEDVADSRGRIYLNFGADWRTDFTAMIAPSDRDAFQNSKIKLLELKGRTIRVRGWLQRRNGPMIEVTHPEQIEYVETGDSALLQSD